MTPTVIAANTIAPQPWRNAGGQTRALLAWPDAGPWRLRISRADIDADGPFSAFPGVTRWFTVLRGAGVVLTLDGVRRELRTDDAALRFDGALAPDCTLLDGPTQDLNLMAIGGDAVMERVVEGSPWSGRWQMRGLYTTVAGLWHSAQAQCPVPADSLLWQPEAASTGAWSFTPHAQAHGSAWWLAFTP